MIFIHEPLALLHHANAVRAQAELDDAGLSGGFQQLDHAHAADGEPLGDSLLGHVFKIVIPCRLDHQRFFIIHRASPLSAIALKYNNNLYAKLLFLTKSISLIYDNVNCFTNRIGLFH